MVPFTWCVSPVTPWTGASAGSSRAPTVTVAVGTIRSTVRGGTLHTGADLLTDKQKDRLTDLFATEEHVQVQATWEIYQRMIAAYREPDRIKGPRADGQSDRVPQPRRPGCVERGHHPPADPEEARRRRAGILRAPRYIQRTDRGDQRTT